MAVQAPVCTLYILAVLSALAVANLVPVVLNDKSRTSSRCPLRVSIHFPVPRSQILQLLSIEPVAQNSPVNSN
jgi:hypothetical protein